MDNIMLVMNRYQEARYSGQQCFIAKLSIVDGQLVTIPIPDTPKNFQPQVPEEIKSDKNDTIMNANSSSKAIDSLN